jgi:hypothetical protein
MNRVVVRFADGRILKGTTADFFPNKDLFHVSVEAAPDGDKPLEVNTQDLKALYFVKEFEGNPQYEEGNQFDPSRPPAGRQIKVVFNDGEVLLGTTMGYQPKRPGFFVVPADASSNNERCYIFAAATKEVSFQ